MKLPMFLFEGEGTGGDGGGGVAAPAAPAGGQTLLSSAPTQQAAPSGQDSWSWASADGAFSPGWLDKLPDGVGASPALKPIGSVADLAKSYVETKRLVGTKLEMPGEGATPEQLAHWRKVVGAPDKPEGYLGDAKTLRPEAVPETLWDGEGEKAFLALAHKHNLPPAAVKDILAFHGDSIAKGLQASQAKEGELLAAEGAKLKEAWGGEFEVNLGMAQRVAVTLGMDPKTDPAFTSAGVVQAFAKMGKLLSEDSLVRGEAPGISGGVEARARDITDPKSTSMLARDYRGENGAERQTAAQKQLHELYAAMSNK